MKIKRRCVAMGNVVAVVVVVVVVELFREKRPDPESIHQLYIICCKKLKS